MKRELEELLFEVKSSQEKLIIETLIKHFNEIPNMKLEEIAKCSYCSKTSVRRIIIKLGYKGYLEYQLHVKIEVENKQGDIGESFDGRLNVNNCNLLLSFIKEADHISIYGVGADSISAQYLFRQLLEIGYTVTWINEIDLLYKIQNDSVIVISNTGRHQNVIKSVKTLQEKQNCKIAAITKKNSELSAVVDLPIVHDLKNSMNKNDPMDAFIIINQISKLL